MREEDLRSKSGRLSFEVVDAISRVVCQLAQLEGHSASPLFPNLLHLNVPVCDCDNDFAGKLMKYVPFLAGAELQVLCFTAILTTICLRKAAMKSRQRMQSYQDSFYHTLTCRRWTYSGAMGVPWNT